MHRTSSLRGLRSTLVLRCVVPTTSSAPTKEATAEAEVPLSSSSPVAPSTSSSSNALNTTKSTSTAIDSPEAHMKHVTPPPATRTQFSFLSEPDHRNVLATHHKARTGIVPNNDAKAPLPMWSSSLTSPKLDLQRHQMDSWIAPHLSAGFHEDSAVDRFVEWICERADAAERAEGLIDNTPTSVSYLSYALKKHVQLKLRAGGSCRGVFARRSFAPGDVILSIPTAVAPTPATATTTTTTTEDATTPNGTPPVDPLWGLTLNSDTMRRYSVAAQQRCVPSYETVWDIVSKRRSSFDPYTHPLFADQIYAALFLACEKEAGEASPLYPYISLLPDPAVDDERMLDIHRGVLTPSSHLEYHDHKNRFHLYIFHLQNAWWEAQSAAKAAAAASSNPEVALSRILPPPSQEALTWAMRTVLARQLMMPNLRPVNSDMTDRLTRETTLTNLLDQENFWMRNITKLRQWWLQNVFQVLDADRMQQFEFEATTIPTIAPLLDMLQHDPKGGNVSWEVEGAHMKDGDGSSIPGGGAPRQHPPELLLVAAKHIKEGQELTRGFRRCYSTSYTLFRYGFLAINDREADTCSDMVDAGVDPHLIGWDRPDVLVPRLAEAQTDKKKRLEQTKEALPLPRRRLVKEVHNQVLTEAAPALGSATTN